MRRLSRRLVMLSAVMLAVQSGSAVATILAWQVDDFEDASVQLWHTSIVNPNPATNIATGGPKGADDNYMQLSSNGSAAAGGKLVVFNDAQWAGNYLTAGVNTIQMQVKNLGLSDLVLRLILDDSVDGLSLTTVSPVTVPVGSGWLKVSFSLDAGNLTGGSFATVMSNVVELNLVNSSIVIASRSSAPNVVAQLGVDSILARSANFPGDCDGSGIVEFNDLNTLLTNYGLPGGFAEGDFDGSGTVEFADLNTLLTNYGVSAPTTAILSPVPEPSGILLSGVTLLALWMMRPKAVRQVR